MPTGSRSLKKFTVDKPKFHIPILAKNKSFNKYNLRQKLYIFL